MKQSEHLTQDLLIRALDDELSAGEATLVESHLYECEICQREHEALRTLSVRLSAAIGNMPAWATEDTRESLWRELEAREQRIFTLGSRANAVRSLQWGIGIAAALAVIALFVPWSHHRKPNSRASSVVAQANGTIEVDGETFVALPYSNPDLPVSPLHIVEMQVPIASLADAGVTFEPISEEAANSDGSVLADVLVGLDGQPLGVHVLSAQ